MLTKEQSEIIDGNLLGDGSIPYSKTKNRFSFSQKESNKEYVEFIQTILSSYSKPIICTKKNMGGKQFISFVVRSESNDIFTNLRKKWYKEPDKVKSAKIIPADFVLNWRKIAFWYADDGCNSQSNQCIYLHSQSFTYNENEMLCSQFSKLGIQTSINSRPNDKFIIRIAIHSYYDFISHVKPYLECIKCLEYKTNTSLASSKSIPQYQQYSDKEIEEAMKLWKTGNYSKRSLARAIGCHHKTISRWVNSM